MKQSSKTYGRAIISDEVINGYVKDAENCSGQFSAKNGKLSSVAARNICKSKISIFRVIPLPR